MNSTSKVALLLSVIACLAACSTQSQKDVAKFAASSAVAVATGTDPHVAYASTEALAGYGKDVLACAAEGFQGCVFPDQPENASPEGMTNEQLEALARKQMRR